MDRSGPQRTQLLHLLHDLQRVEGKVFPRLS